MVDELIYLNISRDKSKSQNTQDMKKFIKLIKELSKHNFMPITIGGKIKNLKQIYQYLKNGADKVSINTEAFNNKKLINDAAKEFGSQCIVISIDVKITDKKYKVFINNGSINTGMNVEEWVSIVQSEGAGEILINSIDRDGSKKGYYFNI